MPEVVRDAVFGNVGTMVSFRIGPGDSTVLGRYFEPVFEAIDLTKLHNQNIFISMIIDGEKAPPFSASTLRMPDPENDQTAKIIEITRARFASSREAVDADIRTRTAGGHDEGARAVGDERKPNKELLGALKNPSAPATDRRPEPRRDDRRGGESAAGAGRRPERDNRDSRDSRGESRGASAPYRPNPPASAPYRPPAPATADKREPALHRLEPVAVVPPPQSPSAPPTALPTPNQAPSVHTIEPGQPISLR